MKIKTPEYIKKGLPKRRDVHSQITHIRNESIYDGEVEFFICHNYKKIGYIKRKVDGDKLLTTIMLTVDGYSLREVDGSTHIFKEYSGKRGRTR